MAPKRAQSDSYNYLHRKSARTYVFKSVITIKKIRGVNLVELSLDIPRWEAKAVVQKNPSADNRVRVSASVRDRSEDPELARSRLRRATAVKSFDSFLYATFETKKPNLIRGKNPNAQEKPTSSQNVDICSGEIGFGSNFRRLLSSA